MHRVLDWWLWTCAARTYCAALSHSLPFPLPLTCRHLALIEPPGFFAQRSVLVPCSEQCATQAVDTDKRRRGAEVELARATYAIACMIMLLGSRWLPWYRWSGEAASATTQQSVPRLDRALFPPPPPHPP